VFVLMKIKRLSMYSTLNFDLKSALGGPPLDAARKKIIVDNPTYFFTGLVYWRMKLALGQRASAYRTGKALGNPVARTEGGPA
jgi:hypothetical protein